MELTELFVGGDGPGVVAALEEALASGLRPWQRGDPLAGRVAAAEYPGAARNFPAEHYVPLAPLALPVGAAGVQRDPACFEVWLVGGDELAALHMRCQEFSALLVGGGELAAPRMRCREFSALIWELPAGRDRLAALLLRGAPPGGRWVRSANYRRDLLPALRPLLPRDPWSADLPRVPEWREPPVTRKPLAVSEAWEGRAAHCSCCGGALTNCGLLSEWRVVCWQCSSGQAKSLQLELVPAAGAEPDAVTLVGLRWDGGRASLVMPGAAQSKKEGKITHCKLFANGALLVPPLARVALLRDAGWRAELAELAGKMGLPPMGAAAYCLARN